MTDRLQRGQRLTFHPAGDMSRTLEGVVDRYGHAGAVLWVVPELGAKSGWWVLPQDVVRVDAPKKGS